MKSSTRLDSALFQLTPTRTRCDLVVSANGKTEKIASGLLNPFLAHLKAARDQMAKGGYSIVLEPEHGSKPSWFTRGTLERFVRFVSTPEVLERVHTLESEILQIEEAISIQSNNEISIHPVESHQTKSADVVEAPRGKSLLDHNDSRAIVLYKPDALPDTNGSAEQADNSKVQLLKVLETRKAVLQKEQGMAFARAVAAGFDIDVMMPLMSFAECFGASRLRDACTRFTELWKRKHETGQWLEIEAAETISSQLDHSHVNGTGIILSDVANKTKEGLSQSPNDLVSEENAKATAGINPDEKHPGNQVPPGPHEYFQGHPYVFPAWPMHSPPGAPMGFQPYPMQAMPYFPNNPGNGPYFQQQPYPPVEDPRVYSGQRVHRRGHSLERRGSGGTLVSPDMDDNLSRSSDELESEDEVESRKKGIRSRRKQSGKVVIRNINYITPTKQSNSDGESSQSQADGDGVEVGTAKMKHSHSNRSSERKGTGSKKEEASYGIEADGEHWQAFQNYLLKEVDEERQIADGGMFSMEKEVWLKRRKNVISDDPLASGRDMDKTPDGLSGDIQILSGKATYMRRMSNDGPMISLRDGVHGDVRNSTGSLDVHFSESGRRSGYRRETDDFIIGNQEDGFIGSSSDRLALNRYEGAGAAGSAGIRSSQNITDDSYIVSLRSACVDEVGNGSREAIDIHSEFPSKSSQGGNDSSKKVVLNYEPDDLSMMTERRMEGQSNGYDPALEYEMQIQRNGDGSLDKTGKEAVTDPKQRTKKLRDPKQALTQDVLRKKNVGPIRKGKPSKLNPLDEAKARAEKLRSYKADLQKMKKEQEEEQAKRLEALKLERQKRIASRSSTNPAQSTVAFQQGRRQLPMKLSPSSHKGSKFSDLEPGSSSPLQRFNVRNASAGSSESQRTSKPSRLSAGGNSAENRLTRSASSLPEAKKQNGGGAEPERKASMTRIRRLSEPKSVRSTGVSLVKPRMELTRPKVAADETTIKKISAIVNLDKSKAATLPELKIRASKAPNAAGSMTVMEPELKGNDVEMKSNIDRSSHIIDQDENPIVEKTMVMLEEKPMFTKAHALDEKHQPQKLQNERGERRELLRPVCPSLSPPILDKIDRKPTQVQDIGTKELVARNEVLIQSSRTSNSEKSYQAPYARVSSLEDPCTTKSAYAKAFPTCSDIKVAESEPVKTQVSDSKKVGPEKITSEMERRQKESAKGFKRLLKFGRKNNNPTASEHDCDEDSIGESEANDSPSKPTSSAEVHTLKTLISQDETPTAASTPKKAAASRTFSLLSPFRSKHSS